MIDTDPPFDINKAVTGEKTARLPMLGLRPTGSIMDVASIAKVRSVEEYLAVLHMQIDDVSKGISGHIAEAAKALSTPVPQAYSYSTMAFMPDPGNYGLMQWPGMNPESLSKVARENAIVQLIIRSRANDLARYSGLSTHAWKPGWRITMRDASETPSRKDRDDIRDAQRFIYNCSRDTEYTEARERDYDMISPFEMYLRGAANEMLTYDGHATWTDMDNKNRVNAFANLPAGMIRLAVPSRGFKGRSKYFAALVDETGTPVKPFTRDELTWRVQNVRLDPSVGGYGWPFIEIGIQLISAFQSAVTLNATTFTNNSIPNGMLLLKGDFFQQDQIDALMREWTNMKRGLSKLWGLPIMAIPDKSEVELLEFMDLKGQEVRYREHMNMMAGLTFFLFQFPIRRLGMFVSGQHRDNAPATDMAIDTQGVDDPGLPALLIHLEETINQYLLWTHWPHLIFEFMNKNPKEDARAYEARKNAQTWAESRAESDLPALTSVVPTDLKRFAEIVEMCPNNPGMAGVFQSLAATMLQAELGETEGQGGEQEKPGARMVPKKDPATSQAHGHLSGTRRNSRAEQRKTKQLDDPNHKGQSEYAGPGGL